MTVTTVTSPHHHALLLASTTDPWVWQRMTGGSWQLVTTGHGVGLVTEWGSLKCVFVDPAHRRQGEGSRITRVAMDLGAYWLEVATSNVGAIAAYRRLGFRPTDRGVYPGFLLMELTDCSADYAAFTAEYDQAHPPHG